MKNYQEFIQAAKDCANRGEEQRLKLMLLLVEYEPKKALWGLNPLGVKTWDSLLREEGLCTPALYHAFKEAVQMRVEVSIFGVYASTAIVKLEKSDRTVALRRTREWVKQHQVPPTYQRISQYVRQLKDEMGIKTPVAPATRLRKENARLKSRIEEQSTYIEKLKALLREHKVRLPKE